MADGDHYATYADIQNIIQNSNVTGLTDTLFNAAGTELALDLTQAIINEYLGESDLTSISDTVGAVLCKHVQLNVVTMMILRARQFKETSLDNMGDMISYWQITPALTPADKQLLDMIKLRTDGVAWAFNTRTGYEVNY